MKRFVLAIALTGLLSVTVLAGEVPTNGAPVTQPPTPQSAPASTVLANVALMIITLIGR
ncbi:MAG TPA: hypothetical protein VJ875_00895 [Pyrinomonadaceae bacterium]|nr:hypothetical protein [Pyrinomonadaceae bacterium]